MQPILTAAEMARADRAAIDALRTSETRLMELAGRETSVILGRHLTGSDEHSLAGYRFLVVCGKGNNGGDGFVLSRHLLNRDAAVDLVLLYPSETLKPVNREGLAILEAYAERSEALTIHRSHDEALPYVAETAYDALIDAVLGTGFRLRESGAPLPHPLKEGIDLLNSIRERSGAVTIAVDLPSGLDATEGFAASPSVRADLTVAMAYPKTGFFFHSGPELCGEVETAEISIPPFLVADCACHRIDAGLATETFTLREPFSAKHKNGKVLVIAGSSSPEASMTGAAILATRAAIACGAGYVCASLPERAMNAIHAAAPSAVVVGRELEAVREKVAWADAVLVGCGMGRTPETVEWIVRLLDEPGMRNRKLVLDADALYAIASAGVDLAEKGFSDAVLTPHAGEFGRLLGTDADDVARNPLENARDFAARQNTNLLLKGRPTLVADPAREVLLNDSGTEALATAGSGDVLSGMIAGLAAKGPSIRDAAATAAWFHGRAGDLASEISSLVSSEDILAAIPEAIAEIFFAEEE